MSAATMNRTQTRKLMLDGSPLVVDLWQPLEAGNNTPILLVHGWGNSGSYWQHTAQELSRTTTVIVPDLPGTGRSQPVQKANDMYAQVDVLVAMLDALQVDRVQLVGHSMGGAMSVLLAAHHPQRVERLVLTSLVFFMTQEQEDFYENLLKMLNFSFRLRPNWLEGVPGVAKLMAQQYFHQVPDNRELLQQGLREYLRLDMATAIACAKNATDDRIRESGYQIQVPTLMICCRQDRVLPLENVLYTQEIIPDCTVRWIEACGHLPMVEKPQEYLALLHEFLET